MESSHFIAIYLPLIIVFVIIIPKQRRYFFMALKLRKKRREEKMSNELIKNCVGKICTISTGSLGSTYNKVLVQEVKDNWLKIVIKGKESLINSDYIQNIRIMS